LGYFVDLQLVTLFGLPLFCKTIPVDAHNPAEITALILADCGLTTVPEGIGLTLFFSFSFSFIFYSLFSLLDLFQLPLSMSLSLT